MELIDKKEEAGMPPPHTHSRDCAKSSMLERVPAKAEAPADQKMPGLSTLKDGNFKLNPRRLVLSIKTFLLSSRILGAYGPLLF